MLKCDGYKIDQRAQFVRAPCNSREVLICISSFGVADVPNCTTTRQLLSMIESTAAHAGYDTPHLVYVDLLPVHVQIAKEFKDKKGSRFYNSPNVKHPLFHPVVDSCQTYTDKVTQALEQAGYRVRHIVLSPDVHECFALAKCSNAALPFMSCHPSGTQKQVRFT